MTDKSVGYILLLSGICVIVYALYSMYMVFTKQNEPVDLFSFSGISLNLHQSVELPDELKEAGVSMDQTDNAGQEIISPEVLNQTSNILAHVVFMGFVVNVGFKIATLGVETNRNVIVKVANHNLAHSSDILKNPTANQ